MRPAILPVSVGRGWVLFGHYGFVINVGSDELPSDVPGLLHRAHRLALTTGTVTLADDGFVVHKTSE